MDLCAGKLIVGTTLQGDPMHFQQQASSRPAAHHILSEQCEQHLVLICHFDECILLLTPFIEHH